MPREVKKTPQVRSKPVKKAVLVRPVAKKTPRKTTPRTIKKVSVTTPAEVVVLPRTASVRLLEKVALYKAWYNDDLPIVVSRVAVGAGYTFVLLGAIFTAFTYSAPAFDRVAQTGATICSDALCTSVPDTALTSDAPQVKFENSLPLEIVDTIDFDVSFTTSKPVVSLKNIKTGNYVALEPQAVVSDRRLKYILAPKDLPESQYQVIATIEYGNVEYQFEGSIFAVPALESEDVVIPDEVELSEETEVVEVLEETATSTDSVTASSSDTQASSTVSLEMEEVVVTPEAIPDQIRNTPFARLEDVSEASYLVIDSGGFLPERVEIFASMPAGTPLFLGTATAVENDWWFSLDALSLPKVPLMLYGQFVADGTLVQTAGVRFGSAITASSTVTAEDEIFRAKVDAALAYQEIEKGFRQQYFSSWASLSVSDIESQIAEPAIIDLADTLMAESASVIDVYLLRYASAQLVGMPTILTLADASIAELSVKLSESVSTESSTALATLMRVRLNLLQEHIRNNERDLKNATNGLIAQDRDNDGFSDYDEIVLYATNPNEADSDSDGIIDSVEVFNTTTSIGELTATTATAQVQSKIITHSDGTKSTLALVEGQSIPNAYLLITHNDSYTSIVKTGAQGGFSYTIDKPLDGEAHHFTLSLMGTDGTQLPVYTTPTFALKNGALELETQNLASVFSTNFDSTQAATLIASITLTTLGFILLYLAFALRTNTQLIARFRAKKALL